MKIVLAIPSLCAGGAERIISRMAAYWSAAGDDVTIVTIRPVDEDFYNLPISVTRVSLDVRRVANSRYEGAIIMLAAMWRLRLKIRALQPDVVISFIEIMNVCTLLALAGTKTPVIVSERIDPRKYPASAVLNRLRGWLYPRARCVVVQTEALRAWASQIVPPDRVSVIPNPIAVPSGSPADNNAPRSRRTAVAMGRLVPQKGFDLLIEAFARCANLHPEWSLLILGEGEAREALEAQALGLNVADRINMPGQVSEPAGFLGSSDLFILSSRYEGFPNALCEAMSLGLPVISSDCPSGPAEIIRNGVDGILVPSENIEALATAMDRLMSDGAERTRLGAGATDITKRFGVDDIMARWGSLLETAHTVPDLVSRNLRCPR